MKLGQLSLLLRTLLNLKPVQVYGRILFKFKNKNPKLGNYPLPVFPEKSPSFISKKKTMYKYREFNFLNHTDSIQSPSDWNDFRNTHLWIFNLHYLDDLLAEDRLARVDEHHKLISEWINENPVGQGNGWHPYPISLRVVNIIKWNLTTKKLTVKENESLVLQVRTLEKSLEHHLMGNHLFVNAWSLIIAGVYFDPSVGEGKNWFDKGMQILSSELVEQILSDGGHFERSPMYHALLLDNMLDLLAFFKSYNLEIPSLWLEKVQKMLNALRGMIHADGEVAFFNDSTIGIAPKPAEIFSFASSLGFESSCNSGEGAISLKEVGLFRNEDSLGRVLIVDGGDIGPGYIFGHSHSDTLSFELSTKSGRVFVNSGISRYGDCTRRLYERSTEAHNTVRIGPFDQSEVWSGFRVARQARAKKVSFSAKDGLVKFLGSHTGYEYLGLEVEREVSLSNEGLLIVDRVNNLRNRSVTAEGFIHLHPRLFVLENEMGYSVVEKTGNRVLDICGRGAVFNCEKYKYAPQLGALVEGRRIRWSAKCSAQLEVTIKIRFNDGSFTV